MPSLLDVVDVIHANDQNEAEDIFGNAIGTLFPDDTQNLHGDADSTLVYKSSKYGNMELSSADPEGESERRLFAHYLWNASIKMAELISEERSPWNVRGQNVLELGAGVGLGGIIAVLAGAEQVLISDYPALRILEIIHQNAQKNIPSKLKSHYSVQGYKWGDVESDFARDNRSRFTRILAADCFWMSHEHKNLVSSMLHFLSDSPEATVTAIGGFHTGRANLAKFFDQAASQGLVPAEIYEEDVEGKTREWCAVTDGGAEDVTARKRWLVIARLKRPHL